MERRTGLGEVKKSSIILTIQEELEGEGHLFAADGNDSVKKKKQTIGLISKTTTLHVHHAFFGHFFLVFTGPRRENA